MSTLTTHLLQRIEGDPRLAFYFDPLTRTMELLTEAHAADHALDLQRFRLAYYPRLRFERPHCTECVGTELLDALRSVVAIAEECAREWDGDNDMRVGKILLGLAGANRGYRPDIDAIHDAIAKAEVAA